MVSRSILSLTIVLLAGAAAADEPKKEKPGKFTLVNKAKDVRVISDRDEPILDYFHRTHVLVGGVVPEELKKVLEARKPLAQFFVNYASSNDDPAKASTFGASIDIAPPTEAVVKLLEERKTNLSKTLILRRDEKKPGLYHLVGCTERSPVGFFAKEKKNPIDKFSQKDLCFKGEAKK